MPSRSATRDYDALAVREQLGLRAVQAVHDGAGGHWDLQILSPLAVLALAAAVLPTARPEVAAAAERGKIAPLRVRDQHDVAAPPAVTAVWAAARDVRLTAEADDAVSSAASLDIDLRSVEEHARRS